MKFSLGDRQCDRAVQHRVADHCFWVAPVLDCFEIVEEAAADHHDAAVARREIFLRPVSDAALPDPGRGAYFYDASVNSDVVVTGMHGSYNEHLSAHAVAFLRALTITCRRSVGSERLRLRCRRAPTRQ
jgi:hypothetical protein